MFFKTASFAKVLSKYICVSLALKMEKVKARGTGPVFICLFRFNSPQNIEYINHEKNKGEKSKIVILYA